jgi:aminoglycoside phosphotransferase (APT) family kinase protein
MVDGGFLTDHDVVVTEASRRHINYRVSVDNRGGYFIKHADTPDRITALAREAGTYSVLSADDSAPRLLHLPAMLDYDPERHILVLELLAGAVNAREYQLRARRFSTSFARILGRVLAMLHNACRLRTEDRATSPTSTEEPPGALTLHQPNLALLTEMSAASLDLIRMIQSVRELGEHLDDLQTQWTRDALIHRDVKWDNVVTHISARTARAGHLIMVDWELAGPGDPDWDTGSVFGDYLNTWLQSIPMDGTDPFDTYLECARYPLQMMQPAMRAFWQSYIRTRSFDLETARTRLVRATRYAAARLVQSAFEQSQTSAELGTGAVAAIQLSVNILQRPREAHVHLLGMP